MHIIYQAIPDMLNEAERLVSWFGVPVLIYLALPLTALAAVLGRLRTFKQMLMVTVLVAAPTVLYWDGIGADLLYFKTHFSGPAPAAPAKNHHVRLAEPDSYIV